MDSNKARQAIPLIAAIDEATAELAKVQAVLDTNTRVTGGHFSVNDPINNNQKVDICAMNLQETTQVIKAMKGVLKDRLDALTAALVAL